MKRDLTFISVEIATESAFRQVLDAFEAQYHVRVNLEIVPWDHYRQAFVNTALHHLPGDVACAGTPTTSDLIAMNALRPFTPGEIQSLGGEASFLPSRWQSGMRPGQPEVWAIPYILDLRLLYYRRDLLARAGVDEKTAFTSSKQFEQTVNKLQACSVEVPWHTVYNDLYGVLHRVSSWIWAYGGDLFTADGSQAIFHQPEAMEGMQAYFNLIKYMPAFSKNLNSRDLLLSGRAGAEIDTGWALFNEVPPEIGCIPTPGGSYVGGSDLMIWNHSDNEGAALELVRFLTKARNAELISRERAYLPMRLNQINELAVDPDPNRRALGQAVLTGRTFPCVPMIGLLEDRLGALLLAIQEEALTNPQADIAALLRQRVVPLGNRTNLSLSSLH